MRKFRPLYDSRFISIIDILIQTNNYLLAVYLIRLIFGFRLSTAAKYTRNTDKILRKSKNHLQYVSYLK